MADEMDDSKDESMDAEEKGATPEEKMTEGVEASSVDGGENPTPEAEAASGDVGSEPGLEAEGSADHDSAYHGLVTVDADAVDTSDHARSPVKASTASADDAKEALFDAAPNVDPQEPQNARPEPAVAAKKDEGHPRADGGELDMPGLDLLYDVELDATLQFGSREMLLRDVLELGPGDVVELDRHIAQPVDLVVGDRIVARGEVVVASGNFALRVTEVAAPQMRLESIRCLF